MEKEKMFNEPMSTFTKRIIFFSLFPLFVLYTFFIAGPVTEFNEGKDALTAGAHSGKILFQKYNCISCHQVYGLGGYMGPDLTNVMSAKGADYVHALLKHGSKQMPNFQLSDNEIADLTSYLNYLDKTGRSPVREFTLNVTGTVSTSQK